MNEVIGYRKRRTTELMLVLFAQLLGFGGYLLSSLALNETLPDNWIMAAVIWFGIGIGAHLAIRLMLPYADPLILPCVLLLNGIGLAMIYRLDQTTTPAGASARSQLLMTALAVVSFIVVIYFIRDHRLLHRFTYLAFLVGLVLMLLPLVPGLGVELNGAKIWIKVGPSTFQPAEVAKIVLCIAFASYLVNKREVLTKAGKQIFGLTLPRARDLGPIVVMWAVSVLVLIFQKDLGTSLLFFGLFVMMLYVATGRPSWPILGTALFVGGAWLGYLFFGHVKVRFSSWLDPFSNFDQNYQVIVGQFGIAWGGLFGTGWGQGRPGLTPLAKSDFIAAAVAEELGLTGLIAVIMIYGIIVARGMRTSLTAREPFGKLLASGLAFIFALQVFSIIGGVTRLLPLTGLTTPFMSAGGSSMVANWVLIALLIIISHRVRKPHSEPDMTPVIADLAEDSTQLMAAATDTPAAQIAALAAKAPALLAPLGRPPRPMTPATTPQAVDAPTVAVAQVAAPDAPTQAMAATGPIQLPNKESEDDQ